MTGMCLYFQSPYVESYTDNDQVSERGLWPAPFDSLVACQI